MLDNFSPPRILDSKFDKRRREDVPYILQNDIQISLSLYQINNLRDQPMYHICGSLCSMCKIKRGHRKLIFISFLELDR